MKHEPFGLYLVRFISGIALFAFMVMLYWSSALVEKDLKFIQGELLQIKNELLLLKEEIGDVPKEALKNSPEHPEAAQDVATQSSANLLTPDPFYASTLPKLLGARFKPHGIRKEASIGKPDNLHPFSNWSQVAGWNAICTLSLTTQEIGRYETFCPEMALSMELRQTPEGQPEYWLSLRKDVFWKPLDP